MIERIRQIGREAAWILAKVIGFDFEIEYALSRLQAALDDLEAVEDPSDEQVEGVLQHWLFCKVN